ncbi:rod shape-determining protein MreC, partial [Pseudomonas amygdali pv. mori str. 301020]
APSREPGSFSGEPDMSMVLMQSYWIVDLPQRLYQGVASQ